MIVHLKLNNEDSFLKNHGSYFLFRRTRSTFDWISTIKSIKGLSVQIKITKKFSTHNFLGKNLLTNFGGAIYDLLEYLEKLKIE